MNARKSIFVAACVVASVFLFSSAQAFAEHKFSKSLPAPTGGFKSPWGVAIGTGGEIFVSNNAGNVVDVYSSSDVFEKEFTVGTAGDKLGQLAVDHSSEAGDPSKGDLYIVDETAGKVFRYEYKSGTATEVGSAVVVALPHGVAVDSKGNLYVSRFELIEEAEEGFIVDKYNPKGETVKAKLIPETGEAAEGTPSSLAIDSSGNVYAAGVNGVIAYNGETGACLNACAKVGDVRRAGGVAVGPEGNIYESKTESSEAKDQVIRVFKPTGSEVEAFDPTHLVKEPHAIALSGTTVYVTSSTGNEVAVFTAGPAKHKLEVKLTGAGTGKVECEVNKTGGFKTCESEYDEGTEITLQGTAGVKSKFAGWSLGTGSASSCTGTSPCTFTIKEDSTITAKFDSESSTFQLTVFKAGEGEVTSSPPGITCGATCSADFVENTEVTLTESPKTGYEFAGWIGCKPVTATTCKVTMTAATEVVAAFLKAGTEGKEGKPGEGVTTKAFSGNEHGCPEGGVEVKAGAAPAVFVCTGAKGTNGTNGKEGKPGTNGTNGTNGSNGAAGGQGPVGPAGPAGAQGPAGPAGQIQLVTCKTVKKKGKNVQQCTTKLVSGTVKFTATGASARATLSRHGAVFAAGLARVAHGHLSLRLTPLRKLRAGHYTLTLISGAGSRETIRTEAFTLG